MSSHLNLILASFESHLNLILASFESHLNLILASFESHLNLVLASFESRLNLVSISGLPISFDRICAVNGRNQTRVLYVSLAHLQPCDQQPRLRPTNKAAAALFSCEPTISIHL